MVGGDRVAVLAGEDEVMVVVRRVLCGSLPVLGEALGEQHADATLAEIHPPRVAAGRLGCPELDPAVLAPARSAAR